ncbi:MAG: helix-turn-helix domain-containing protein [Bacillota bacterium]
MDTVLADILRIQKAQRLLRETDLTISAISQECGFESPSYFSATFRRETGYSPSAYRRLL